MLYVYNDFAYIEENFDMKSGSTYILPPNINKNNIICSSPFTINYNNIAKIYKDENVYEGELMTYSDSNVTIKQNNSTIIIRNYDYIEQDNYTLKMKFEQDDYFTKLLYRVDEIKSRTEYILYVSDDKVIEMVENMIIDNNWNDIKFNKIYFISGVNDNIHLYKSFNITPKLAQMSITDSNMIGTNKSLDDYRIYTHDFSGKLIKNTLMSTPRTIGASGEKVYIIDSRYVRGPIQYGFELTPLENIYNNSGKIIDAKTNIILSDITFPKIQRRNKRLIIAGTTTSINVDIISRLATEVERNRDVYEYTFILHVKNENDYTAKIYFKHKINFENYTLITHPDEIHGNSAVWIMSIPRQEMVSQRYNLSFSIKKDSK